MGKDDSENSAAQKNNNEGLSAIGLKLRGIEEGDGYPADAVIREIQQRTTVLDSPLAFLTHGLTSHPERLQVVDEGFVQRIQSLIDGVDVDLDAPLSVDDE